MRQGQLEAAFSAYKEVLGLGARLAEADPENLENRRDMLVTHYKMGVVLEAAKKPGQALQEYKAALDLAQETKKEYGKDDQLDNDIAEVQEKIDTLSN